MKELTKQELFELFEAQPKKQYKKAGVFLHRIATCQETILTIVAGKLETMKKAQIGDVILRNIEVGSSAETYIISNQKFYDRYDITSESHLVDGSPWIICHARGKIEAFEFKDELNSDCIRFIAPWNTEMICFRGDFIARPLNGDPNDIYRIEQATFLQTYTEMSTNEQEVIVEKTQASV